MTLSTVDFSSPVVSGVFHELSSLVPIRLHYQSEEEACSVCVAHTKTARTKASEPSSDDTEFTLDPHNPKVTALQDSEWWKLLKKIHKIIKVSRSPTKPAQGESTGLNRCNRWTTDKVAAGLSIYATSGYATSGNVANAQATAQKSAQTVSTCLVCLQAQETLTCSINADREAVH